jgi:glucan-binding YG repeat protein
MSNEKGWWITQIDGTWYPKEEWYKISGSWYYFDSKGYMVTGTKTIDGRIYSFNSNGELVG